MFDKNQLKKLIIEISMTIEIIGSRKISDDAILVIISDLYQNKISNYEYLLEALHKIRAEFSGNLTQKLIIDFYNSINNQKGCVYLLEKKESEIETKLRKENGIKNLRIISFFLANQTLKDIIKNTPERENEDFYKKVTRILNENEHLKKQFIEFFKEKQQNESNI